MRVLFLYTHLTGRHQQKSSHSVTLEFIHQYTLKPIFLYRRCCVFACRKVVVEVGLQSKLREKGARQRRTSLSITLSSRTDIHTNTQLLAGTVAKHLLFAFFLLFSYSLIYSHSPMGLMKCVFASFASKATFFSFIWLCQLPSDRGEVAFYLAIDKKGRPSLNQLRHTFAELP